MAKKNVTTQPDAEKRVKLLETYIRSDFARRGKSIRTSLEKLGEDVRFVFGYNDMHVDGARQYVDTFITGMTETDDDHA
jgi:hypothetical protein